MAAKVVVVGSVNMDVVIQTEHFPAVGETLMARQVRLFPGGKGANQAVAAARLGAEVVFLGAVGDDEHGQYLSQALAAEKINLSYLQKLPDIRTGTAYITTDGNQNQIIVDAAANNHVSRDYIKKHRDTISSADIILLQLEIPLPTVWEVIDFAYDRGIPVILNPAPAAVIKPEILPKITLLTPNEHEILTLTDSNNLNPIPENIFSVFKERLIITCGDRGVMYYRDGKICRLPAYTVPVIDSTGAGDVFSGAIAAFWFEDYRRRLELAVAAAALAVTKLGAQSASPDLAAVQDFLTSRPQTVGSL